MPRGEHFGLEVIEGVFDKNLDRVANPNNETVRDPRDSMELARVFGFWYGVQDEEGPRRRVNFVTNDQLVTTEFLRRFRTIVRRADRNSRGKSLIEKWLSKC